MATRSAVRCRVPDSWGFDAGVRHELDGRPEDVAGVPVADDGAVHLGQFAQPRWREVDADVEAARTDGVDGPVRAQHDQCAGASAENAFQAVPQRGPRGHPPQSRFERLFRAPSHRYSLQRCRRGLQVCRFSVVRRQDQKYSVSRMHHPRGRLPQQPHGQALKCPVGGLRNRHPEWVRRRLAGGRFWPAFGADSAPAINLKPWLAGSAATRPRDSRSI
jgi:hypothetical protein